MLNIILFKDTRKIFTSMENAICIHMDDGKVMKFNEVGSGLYLLISSDTTTKKKVSAYSYLTLVKVNNFFSEYGKRI